MWLETFSGYEMIRNNLARKEKVDFTPINIVYEPSFDENVPVTCNFTDRIHLAYKCHVGGFDKGKKKKINTAV